MSLTPLHRSANRPRSRLGVLATIKKQAVFYGNGLLYNQGDPVLFSTLAFAATSVKFTLTESVSYAFKATFIGNANGNGAVAEIDAHIGSSDGAGVIYAGASQTSSSTFLTLPFVGDVGFSSGMLAAGNYSFDFREQVSHGNGGILIGGFQLILSREHPEHPP